MASLEDGRLQTHAHAGGSSGGWRYRGNPELRLGEFGGDEPDADAVRPSYFGEGAEVPCSDRRRCCSRVLEPRMPGDERVESCRTASPTPTRANSTWLRSDGVLGAMSWGRKRLRGPWSRCRCDRPVSVGSFGDSLCERTVVSPLANQLEVGDTVWVSWGLDEPVRATILEVWGDPPAHIRVQLHPEGADESEDSTIILISPDVLKLLPDRVNAVLDGPQEPVDVASEPDDLVSDTTSHRANATRRHRANDVERYLSA